MTVCMNILTITSMIFQIKNLDLRVAVHDIERAGCLWREDLYTLVVTRVHELMCLCRFHSCSSTKLCTLTVEISPSSWASSTSNSPLSVVTVNVKSY